MKCEEYLTAYYVKSLSVPFSTKKTATLIKNKYIMSSSLTIWTLELLFKIKLKQVKYENIFPNKIWLFFFISIIYWNFIKFQIIVAVYFPETIFIFWIILSPWSTYNGIYLKIFCFIFNYTRRVLYFNNTWNLEIIPM